MAMHKIAIIGGSGFIGSYINNRLVKRGCSLTLPTRRLERHKRDLIILPNTQVVETSVSSQQALNQLLQGHDAVISMVGILHGSRQQFEAVHVGLVDKLIAACNQNGIKRLVHISALGASTSAPSNYQQTKGQAEEQIKASGLDWTILRPSVVFGQGDSFLTLFANLLAAVPIVPLAGATTRFAPVWADDVAHAVEACLFNPRTIGQSLDLAGPDTYTLAELVAYVGKLTGHPRPIIGLPYALAYLQAMTMEYLPGQPPISRDNVRSLKVDNISPLPFPTELLGFTPSALTAVAPSYLGADEINNVLSRYREQVVNRKS